MAGIQINGVFDTRWPTLSDRRSGKLVGSVTVPYASATEMLAMIDTECPVSRRVPGLIIFSVNDAATDIDWWQFVGGVEKENLVKKQLGGGGGGSAPTLQEVLTAGSNIAGEKTISGDYSSLFLNQLDALRFYVQAFSVIAKNAGNTAQAGLSVHPSGPNIGHTDLVNLLYTYLRIYPGIFDFSHRDDDDNIQQMIFYIRGLPNSVQSKILFYDPVSGYISYSDAPAGGTTDIPVEEPLYVDEVDNNTLKYRAPYKVYTALLNQTATDDPVATVLQNTLGGEIIWTRDSVGQYTGTLAGAFTANKTVLFMQGSSYGDFMSYDINEKLYRNSLNDLKIVTESADDAFPSTDDALRNTSIEIRVYP